jgi:uncharacterized surface protein with fasciclin (FAS1) repeats
LLTAFCAFSLSQAAILKFGGPIDGVQAMTGSNAKGSAVLSLDTETNTFDLTVNLFDLSSPLSMSHIHVGAREETGDVIYDIDDQSAYTVIGGFYSISIEDVEFPTMSLVDLLAGNTYLNFLTSSIVDEVEVGFPNGEVRGHLTPINAGEDALINLSTRGMVNPGNGKAGLLIGGLVIQKPKTIFFRMVADSLTRFGVQTSLKDTSFEVYETTPGGSLTETLIGGNDNWKENGQRYRIAMTGIAPEFDNESALFIDLQPGTYTLNANSEQGAGIALIEVYGTEAKGIGESIAAGSDEGNIVQEFTILNAALEATGLTAVLNGPGPFTLFAPTDEAFLATYTETDLAELLADDGDKEDDLTTLTGILLKHVVGGSILSAALVENETTTVTILMDTEIDIQLNDGGITVNNANVLEGDLTFTNGVIHVIDAVLEFGSED